jgi:hypothetical protein
MNPNNITSDNALLESSPTPAPKGKTAKVIANTVYAGPSAIDERLVKLDREWTIGRAIKVTAALCMLIGLGLALFVNMWWLLLPIGFSVLLLQYTVSRDSMLTALFHKLGLRSSTTIQHERTTLKALRGDFRHLPTAYDKDDKDALERLEGEGGIATPPEKKAEQIKATTHVAVAQVLETVKQ